MSGEEIKTLWGDFLHAFTEEKQITAIEAKKSKVRDVMLGSFKNPKDMMETNFHPYFPYKVYGAVEVP